MTTRNVRRVRSNGKEFLNAGLNVTDNPLIADFNEMVEARNILIGSTLARKKRGGQEYFNTDATDSTANYPLNPKNNGGADGDAIRGLYEFWRYDSGTGNPKTSLMVRSGTKIWGINARTGAATDLTGGITSLQTTGIITFQTFEGRVYWTSTNPLEGLYCWDGVSASAEEVVNIAASFDAAVSGVTGNVELSADITGTIGNSILLSGDGAKTLNTLVSDWNTANPSNTVTLDSANGTDVPAGATSMQLAGGLQKLPPDGTPSYIVSHGGRMWAFGVPGFPYRLYASEFYDATSWAVNVFGSSGTAAEPTSLDLDPFGDPRGITGAVSFQGKLYTFMQRAIFEVSGFTINDFSVQTINRQIGSISHHSIVAVENDVIYASERGVLKLSSTDKAIESDYAFASRPISRLWNESLNRNIQENYSATYDERENLYLLSVASSGQTEGDTILVYNVQNNVWATWDNHRARVLSTYIVDGVNRTIAGREDGIISVMGSETRKDLGKAYTSKYKTGILFPGGEMDVEHMFKHLTLLASTDGDGSLTLNMFVDSKLVNTETVDITSGKDLLGTTFVLGQSALGSGIFIPTTWPIGAKGYGFQIEVIINTENDVETYGFMVDLVSADQRVAGGA